MNIAASLGGTVELNPASEHVRISCASARHSSNFQTCGWHCRFLDSRIEPYSSRMAAIWPLGREIRRSGLDNVADISGARYKQCMKHQFLPILGSILALTACSDWKKSTSLTSPDGKTIAQIEISIAGAPAGDRTRVKIRNGVGGELPEPVDVVEAKNAIVDYTRLRWKDNTHLEVTLCEATSFHVIAENMRDPAYISVGRSDGVGESNSVWVDVLNLTYSEKAHLCLPRGNAN